jgi:hypothetical protein
MLDFTYACRGCDHDFSLLVGDPRAALCPSCSRDVREDLTAEFSREFASGIIEELGRENAEVPPPDPQLLYDELVGALLDVQDLISATAPAGAHCRPEDGPLYRRVFDALQKAAA